MRLPLLSLAFLLGGCSLLDFDVDQTIHEQHIQGSGLPEPVGGTFPLPLDLDLGAAIKARDTGPIDGVTLSSLSLTITATDRPAGDSDDWSFLTACDVFVRSTRDGTRLPQLRIAHVDHPGAVTTLAFDVDSGVDLQAYVDEGAAIETAATGTLPLDDVSFNGKAVFTVHPI